MQIKEKTLVIITNEELQNKVLASLKKTISNVWRKALL
jgi:hypothetical protein